MFSSLWPHPFFLCISFRNLHVRFHLLTQISDPLLCARLLASSATSIAMLGLSPNVGDLNGFSAAAGVCIALVCNHPKWALTYDCSSSRLQVLLILLIIYYIVNIFLVYSSLPDPNFVKGAWAIAVFEVSPPIDKHKRSAFFHQLIILISFRLTRPLTEPCLLTQLRSRPTWTAPMSHP